jgi:hypothetical protein
VKKRILAVVLALTLFAGVPALAHSVNHCHHTGNDHPGIIYTDSANYGHTSYSVYDYNSGGSTRRYELTHRHYFRTSSITNWHYQNTTYQSFTVEGCILHMGH